LENAKGPAVYQVAEILTNRYLFEDIKRAFISQKESADKYFFLHNSLSK